MTGSVAVPRVSVVIPVYNAKDVIRGTIESALAQTWKDFEIVVVDDGSSDGSGEIVRSFGSQVHCVSQANGGVARARNRGIAESEGPYIAFLDHDDLWHPRKLERQVALLDSLPDVGMVITDVAHIDRSGKPMGIVGPGYNPAETFAKLFVQGYVPTPSAALIRRSVLNSVGGFDERFNSAGMDDQELWTRIAARYEIANIPESMTYHRNREVKPAQIAFDHRPVLLSTLLQRFGDDAAKRRYLMREQASYLADHGKQLVKEGSARQGRSHLKEGLVLSLGEARSLKTAWRCLLRLTRSYV